VRAEAWFPAAVARLAVGVPRIVGVDQVRRVPAQRRRWISALPGGIASSRPRTGCMPTSASYLHLAPERGGDAACRLRRLPATPCSGHRDSSPLSMIRAGVASPPPHRPAAPPRVTGLRGVRNGRRAHTPWPRATGRGRGATCRVALLLSSGEHRENLPTLIGFPRLRGAYSPTARSASAAGASGGC
jgi:hypothetical protein